MRTVLCCVLAALLLSPALAQEIYKVVDENGNVTYTDKKPDDDARPMELPELNVLESDAEAVEALAEPEGETEGENRDGRSGGLNFVIDRPQDGEEMPVPAGGLMVEMDIDIEIPPAAQIVLFLNGQPLEPVHALETSIDPPTPGDYQLRAELQTPNGRVLARTEAIRFRVLEPGAESADQ